MKQTAFKTEQYAKLRPANASSVLEYGLKYRLQIAWRTGDNLQHLRGRRLLLQRFAQLAKQPRILDGYHSLARKIRHQFNLLIGERLHLLSIDRNGANQL